MTLPAGITTCTVTIGKALGSLGEDASLSGTLTLDRRLVWSATGDTLYGVPSTVTPSQSGGWLSFIVAHVDQAGFVDQSGNSITGFSYTFNGRATFTDGSVEPIVKHFQVFVGQSTLDLDLLPDGPVTLPVSTPIPPVDNAAVAGFVTNAGATKDALSSAYAPKAATYASGVAYVVGQLVVSGTTLYRVTAAHTSSGAINLSNFATAGGGGGTAATTTFTPAGSIAATDVQAALVEVASDASNDASSKAVTIADKGPWLPATSYARGDLVTQFGSRYIAAVAHTSASSFITDNGTGKWTNLATPDMRNASRQGGLQVFRYNLGGSRAGVANTKVAVIGDSTAFGQTSDLGASYAYSWPVRVRECIQRAPGLTFGRGFQNPAGADADSWTVPSGWSGSGVNNTGLRADSAPAGSVVSASIPCAGVNVYGWRNVGTTGKGTVQIDGGAPVSIDETTGTNGLFKVNVPATPGNHTITIAWTSGIFALPYIEIIPSAVGAVSIFNGGKGGATVSTFQSDSSPAGLNDGGVFNSILGWSTIIISLGINEFLSNINPTTYQTNLSTLVATVVGIGAQPIIVVEAPPPNPDTGQTYKWSQYVAAAYAVADAAGCALLDPTPRYGTRAQMVAAGSANSVHGNAADYGDFGAWVFGALFT